MQDWKNKDINRISRWNLQFHLVGRKMEGVKPRGKVR
jgi:hypothetical protein